jgi:hypothetical protein
MNLQTNKQPLRYDLIFIGASFAGCLAAIRTQASNPKRRILIIEQQKHLGGRKSSSVWDDKIWGCGNFSLSKNLLDFLLNSLRAIGQEKSLEILQNLKPQNKIEVIYQNNIKNFDKKKFLKNNAPKLIGGREGEKQWKHIWEQLLIPENSSSLKKVLKSQPKGPAGVLLKTMGSFLGLSDFYNSSAEIIKSSYEHSNTQEYLCNWQDIFAQVLKDCENIDIKLDTQVLNSNYQNNKWTLDTPTEEVTTNKIIVCHSPWILSWLHPESIPASIHKWSLKNQPATIVCLTKKLKSHWQDANSLFIVAEGVKALVYNDIIHFILAIEYNESLNAPSVTKSIRKLKRAATKLAKAYDCEYLGEHIGLCPVGQMHSIMTKSPLGELKQQEQNNLFFCGSFYGDSFNQEKNIISSVLEFDKWLNKNY